MTSKLDIRFIFETKNDGYGIETFAARVVYVDPAGPVKNPVDSDRYSDFGDISGLANLTVTAQRNTDSSDRLTAYDSTADNRWYGFEVSYRDVYSVDARRAETMVKTLRKVARKLDKLTTTLGYPNDLADFCARVAIALGCTDARPFGRYTRELNHTGSHYRWSDVDSLRHALTPATAD